MNIEYEDLPEDFKNNTATPDYLKTALTVTKSDRQILSSEELMEWLFSQGTKQADVWFNQILPVAQIVGYKMIFKETYMRKRAVFVREEFGLNNCQTIGTDVPALTDFSSYFVPKGYLINEANGISKFDTQALEYKVVFPHPILIAKRYKNLNTGSHSVAVFYYDNGFTGEFIVNLYTVSNAQQIQALTKHGVRVTSENAGFLVSFLASMLDINVTKIKIMDSISVLGWHKEQFLPYAKNVEFDGNDYAKTIFNAVRCEGDFDLWKRHVLDSIKNDYVRIYMATSFSSPLLHYTKKPIYITHLWGKSGTAKTVALLLALSVWGNPKHLQCQWNATVVAAEQKAIILNNIPMSMNESELLHGSKGTFQSHADFIYMYCEGESKPRGAKDGGLQIGGKWNSACLSNGEGSLVTEKSKEGELNRVLEFQTDEKLFGTEEKAIEIANFAKENFGYAGRLFTEKCLNYDLDLYWSRFFEVTKECATGKQAGEMASLLLGDFLMQVIIYNQDIEKSFLKSVNFFHRMKNNLKTTADIDISTRAEDFLKGWIAQNINNFIGIERKTDSEPSQIYGAIKDEKIYIIANVFNKIIVEQNYNLGKIKKDFKEKGIFAKVGKDSVTVPWRIKDNVVKCYCFYYGKDPVQFSLISEEILGEDMPRQFL